MKTFDGLVYDIEIARAIPNNDEPRLPGIEYCDGWGLYKNMGVSCIGVIDLITGAPRMFMKDNFADFSKLCDQRKMLVSFNGINFDNRVLEACLDIRLEPKKCYDLLREIWASSGLGSVFNPRTHGGYGLDAVCEENFGTHKTGSGAMAPVWFQRGEYGRLVDYCLNDCLLTANLFEHVLEEKPVKCSKTGKWLKVRSPLENKGELS